MYYAWTPWILVKKGLKLLYGYRLTHKTSTFITEVLHLLVGVQLFEMTVQVK